MELERLETKLSTFHTYHSVILIVFAGLVHRLYSKTSFYCCCSCDNVVVVIATSTVAGHDDGEGAPERGATCLPKKVLVKVTQPLVLLPPAILKYFPLYSTPTVHSILDIILTFTFNIVVPSLPSCCIHSMYLSIYFYYCPSFMMMLTPQFLNTTSPNTHNTVSDERLTAGASLLQSHIFYLSLNFFAYGSQEF